MQLAWPLRCEAGAHGNDKCITLTAQSTSVPKLRTRLEPASRRANMETGRDPTQLEAQPYIPPDVDGRIPVSTVYGR